MQIDEYIKWKMKWRYWYTGQSIKLNKCRSRIDRNHFMCNCTKCFFSFIFHHIFVHHGNRINLQWAINLFICILFWHFHPLYLVIMSVLSSAACHPICLEHCVVMFEEFKACSVFSSILYILAKYYQHWLVVWYMTTLNSLLLCNIIKTHNESFPLKWITVFCSAK